MIINILLAYLGSILCYYLTLSFINIRPSFRQIVLPISLITVIVFFWKRILNTSPALYTVFLVLLFTVVIFLFHKTNLFISFIGSLLTFITLTFGSMLLACPLFVYLGWDVTKIKMSPHFDWIILNLAEYFFPFIILFILRCKKTSIIGHLKFIQE